MRQHLGFSCIHIYSKEKTPVFGWVNREVNPSFCLPIFSDILYTFLCLDFFESKNSIRIEALYSCQQLSVTSSQTMRLMKASWFNQILIIFEGGGNKVVLQSMWFFLLLWVSSLLVCLHFTRSLNTTRPWRTKHTSTISVTNNNGIQPTGLAFHHHCVYVILESSWSHFLSVMHPRQTRTNHVGGSIFVTLTDDKSWVYCA